MRDKKECMYIASCSMGKDSLAMVQNARLCMLAKAGVNLYV